MQGGGGGGGGGGEKEKKLMKVHNFFLSLLLLVRCILSLLQAFLNNTELKNIWLPPGIKLTCSTHKRSAVPLNSINTGLECLFAGWLS